MLFDSTTKAYKELERPPRVRLKEDLKSGSKSDIEDVVG